jgi:hypothetical protein
MFDKLQSLGITTSTLITQGPASDVGASGGGGILARLASAMIIPSTSGGSIQAMFPEYSGVIGGPVRGRLTDLPCTLNVSRMGGTASLSAFWGGAARAVYPIYKREIGGSVKAKLTCGTDSSGSLPPGSLPLGVPGIAGGLNTPGNDVLPPGGSKYIADAIRACSAKHGLWNSLTGACADHLGYDVDRVCTEISFIGNVLDPGTIPNFKRYCQEDYGCPAGYKADGTKIPDPGSGSKNAGKTLGCVQSGIDVPGN